MFWHVKEVLVGAKEVVSDQSEIRTRAHVGTEKEQE